MQSNHNLDHRSSKAELAFRKAFERLKRGEPERVPQGTLVSQNNVAKEAGCDPSALRKTRYPKLISDIQRWVRARESNIPPSGREAKLTERSRRRDMKTTIDELKAERDHATSLLLEADAKILELTLECARLQALQPKTNVSPLRRGKATDREK